MFPIAAFATGAVILIYNGVIAAHPSGVAFGVGMVLAGIGPAGLVDVIRKIP